jgi:integrase
VPYIETRYNSNGSTSYRVKVYVGEERRRRTKTFAKMGEARAWAAAQEDGKRRGTLQDGAAVPLGVALDHYRTEELPRLALSERRNRERHLTWWREALGSHTPLLQVTRGLVRAKLDALRTHGQREKAITPATVHRYRAALSAVLSMAADLEWIAINPLHSGSRRRRPNAERPAERERELEPAEKAALWATCRDSREKRLYPLLVCAYASGAREGELMALEWRHVQLEPRDFDPARREEVAGTARARATGTKAGEDRVLYFPGEAGELLRAMARTPRLSRYVFAGPSDGPADVPTFPAGAWRYAKHRAKLVDFRFHDLRHAWACNLLDSGASLPQLMILGGWKSPAMVRRYASRAQRRGSAAVEAMAQRGLL